MTKFQKLKLFISPALLILASVYWTFFQECNADISWNNFAVCLGCTGKRLVVSGNVFQPRLIAKGSSLIWVRMDCSYSCAIQDSCHAFNFYEIETFYVCELLSDNLRRNRTELLLSNHPGCSVWEKLSTGLNTRTAEIGTQLTPRAKTEITHSITATVPITSIVTTSSSIKTSTSLSTGIALPTTKMTPLLCAAVRPGCLGTYPNCNSCIKTCKDFWARADRTDTRVTLWPDGDGPNSVPVRAECVTSTLLLIERAINLTSRTEKKNYLLSHNDMYRLFQLKVYPYLRFIFSTSDKAGKQKTDISDYRNVSISPNGTLSNLTFDTRQYANIDIFKLKGQPMKPTPFVNVTDDRYGCGSFWLLNASNATYCPGGAVGMFGTLRTNSTHVLNTGIRLPTTMNGLTFHVKAFLMS